MSVQKCECGNVLLDEEEQTNELCAACVKRFETMTAQSEPLETPSDNKEPYIPSWAEHNLHQRIKRNEALIAKETPSELDVLIIRVLFGGKIPLDTDEQMQLARRIPEFRAAVERLIAREVRKAETRMLETPLKDLTMEQKLEAKQLIEYSIEHHATLTNTESKDE